MTKAGVPVAFERFLRRLGTDEGVDAVGFQERVEPGVQLFGSASRDALFSQARQGSESARECAMAHWMRSRSSTINWS